MTPYFDDGQVTIYCGDAREILPSIDGVDLLLTDPPYGIGYQHGTRKGGNMLGMDGHRIAGDTEPFDPTPLLTYPRVVLWGGNHFADRLPVSRGWLIWDKRTGTPSNDQSDCEMAWTNLLNVARLFSARWSGRHRTGREQRDGRLHVMQKPVALMAWCIRLAQSSGLICDPYMGSGTTLVAAREHGYRAIGIELEERYCAIAVDRLRQGVLL